MCLSVALGSFFVKNKFGLTSIRNFAHYCKDICAVFQRHHHHKKLHCHIKQIKFGEVTSLTRDERTTWNTLKLQ